MEFLPTVIRAEYRGGYMIHLTFSDGVQKTIDFAPWLEGLVFEPLKDVEYFRRFSLEGARSLGPMVLISPRRRFTSARGRVKRPNSEVRQVGVDLTNRDGFQKLKARQ